jgi:hypothetical protein
MVISLLSRVPYALQMQGSDQQQIHAGSMIEQRKEVLDSNKTKVTDCNACADCCLVILFYLTAFDLEKGQDTLSFERQI